MKCHDKVAKCHDIFAIFMFPFFVVSRGANDMRQLASYSNSTRSKLNSSELDSSSSSTRNVNESSRATRNSTRKAREILENILYIKF